MSGELFHADVEKGEAHFRANHLAKVGRLAEIAQQLRPSVVRLLAARMDRSGAGALYWKSTADSCSRPVEAILRRVIRDGVGPVVRLTAGRVKAWITAGSRKQSCRSRGSSSGNLKTE